MQEFNLQKKYNWELAHKPIAEDPCSEQPYRTGIFDDYPWYVTPTMVPTCNKVIDTPAYPTALPVNLTGYKVVGSLWANNIIDRLVEYIGTVEITGSTGFQLFPWKMDGSITAYDDDFGLNLTTPLACGALVTKTSTNTTINTKVVTIIPEQVAPNVYDLYLLIDCGSDFSAEVVAFEYSFFIEERDNVNFIIY